MNNKLPDWTEEYDWAQFYASRVLPAPEDWVVHSAYHDRIVWYQYPDTGHQVTADRDYVLNTPSDTIHPPYNERSAVAVLVPCWPDEVAAWETTPWFELDISGEHVISLIDCPVDHDGSDLWWRVIAEILARYSRGEAYGTVVSDCDATSMIHHR